MRWRPAAISGASTDPHRRESIRIKQDTESLRSSEATWQIEKDLAVQSLDLTGHLPEGNQPGARFWAMVEDHALNDLKQTGNLDRFDRNHCPFVVKVVTPVVSTPTPAPSPITCLPVPPPSSPPPAQPGTPGTPGSPIGSPFPGGAVPEPSGLMLAGIGLVIAWIGGRIVARSPKRRNAC